MDTAQFFDIQALTFDPRLQIRVQIDEERIAQYSESMTTEEDMKDFPPVEIFYDGVKYWLADGHHRRAAAENAGHKKIWAVVKSGTIDDAIAVAISANWKQGCGLTRADRRRALEIAITAWPEKSTTLIAETIKCPQSTIDRIKRELTQMGKLTLPEKTLGKDGKSRPAKQKTQKQASTKESPKQEDPPVEPTDEAAPEPTEQPSEQASQFRPGSLPTKKYVGETQLKPIPRDRSNLDTVRLGQTDGTLSSLHTQTVRSFLAGRFCQTANRWSNAEVNQEYSKHHEAINHVVEIFSSCKDKKVNDPTIRGLLARAYYHVAPERITEFATKLIHCNGKGGDPISVLWQCLHVWTDRRENTKCEIYRRGMQTFLAFLQNRTDTSRIDVSTDIFPIPQGEDVNTDEA